MRKQLLRCALFCVVALAAGVGNGAVSVDQLPLLADADPAGPACRVLAANSSGMTLELELPFLNSEERQVAGETYQLLTLPGGSLEGEPGEAGLPVLTKLVAVPATAAVQARLISREEKTLEGFQIYPQQPVDSESFTKDARYYERVGLGEQPAVAVGEPALLRNLRVVPVTFRPVEYDPATGQVVVASRLTVELSFAGRDDTNAGPAPAQFIPRSFDNLYRKAVVGYDRGAAEVGPGSYLIICPNNSTVISYLGPLLDWRRRQGYNVVLATTDETGTSNFNIKSYIQTAYATYDPPLEFVALAGDANGSYPVSTWYETVSGYNGDGDHYYTTLAGGDQLPDVHLGRLSFRTTGELSDIVSKIVDYESDPHLSPDPGWFQRASLTGDPSSSGPSCIYISQWVKNQLLDLGYTQVDTIWSGNFPSLMSADLNEGNTIFTYRGYLGMSNFTTSHINSSTNGQKLPFAVILTCDTGAFASDAECRSEAFLRHGGGGGIAAIGTATWGTHTRFNNCMFAGIIEGVLNTGDFRVGPALSHGKLEFYNNYWLADPVRVETWCVWNTLIGDPATEIWTSEPKDLFVDFPGTVAVGASSVGLTVTGTGSVPLPDAQVTLYKAGQIQVTGYTDASGYVSLPLASHTAGSLLVTVTKHDFQPYLGSLTLGSDSVYLDASASAVDDDGSGQSSGNGDGLVNPGETIELDVEVSNLGTGSASSVTATLSSNDPYVTISDGSDSYGTIGSGGSSWGSGGYVFSLASGAPAGRVLEFELLAESGADSWRCLVEVTVFAGAFSARGGFHFGGPGGDLDPGESGTLSIDMINSGNIALSSATATLVSQSPWVNVTDPVGSWGAMAVGQAQENYGDPFEIAITGDCYQGHLASLWVLLETAAGAQDTVFFQATVGEKSTNDPVGPDNYGYLAFDDTDTGYDFAPTYSWVEIDPGYGGSGTNTGLGSNDQTVTVSLPFEFSFYGQPYDQISICSNGWAALGRTYLVNYRNWTIPNAGGPDNLLAVFWDDLYFSSSGVYYWHDTANHRFVVEWSRMRNDVGGNTETFEAILYDPVYHATDTGDGLIVYQYETVYNIDSQNGYATVGIQNTDHSDGLLYTYWNQYAGGGASLAAGRAIAFRPVVVQAVGYVEGDITNMTGGGTPVDEATVRIVESGRSANSQGDGHYFASTPPGNYTVTVEHASFLPDTTYNVVVVEDQTTVVDFALTDIGGPEIVPDVLTNTGDTVGPYVVQATITDYSPLAEMHFYYTSSADGGRAHELTLQVVDLGAGLYEVEIPGQPLGTLIQYWLTASDIAANSATAPVGAPWNNNSFQIVGCSNLVDDFEVDLGWTVGDAGDDATTGIWTRVDPNGVWDGGTEVQPEDDATPDPGVMCYITGNDPAGAPQGTDDIDGGKTTLLTPWLDLGGCDSAALSYKRWYTNDTGASPGEDYWVVQATNNGTSWVYLENTNTSNRSWVTQNFALESYITLSSTVRLRFIASDEGSGSVVEAGVDDFSLVAYDPLVDSGPPTVTVNDPNGGEVILGGEGQYYTVRWNAADDIGVVKTHILLSTDGGGSYPDTLASGALDSTFVWDVPDVAYPSCRIKVVCLDALQNAASDESDADFTLTDVTGLGDAPALVLALDQNRPNPFNPRTEIRFSLPAEQHATLKIYNLEGRLVRTLVDEVLTAGAHKAVWSGQDNHGARVASGLYFYRLGTKQGILTRKMMLLK